MKPVIFGGGSAACMKARTLSRYGVKSVMVCPQEPNGLSELNPSPIWVCDHYEKTHMDGATLVIAATDNEDLNRQINREARQRGIAVLNVSEGLEGSLCFQRSESIENITVSVFTGGYSPTVSTGILEDLMVTLNEKQWPERVRLLGEIRCTLKAMEPDREKRMQRMRELSSISLEELRKRRSDYED